MEYVFLAESQLLERVISIVAVNELDLLSFALRSPLHYNVAGLCIEYLYLSTDNFFFSCDVSLRELDAVKLSVFHLELVKLIACRLSFFVNHCHFTVSINCKVNALCIGVTVRSTLFYHYINGISCKVVDRDLFSLAR